MLLMHLISMFTSSAEWPGLFLAVLLCRNGMLIAGFVLAFAAVIPLALEICAWWQESREAGEQGDVRFHEVRN